MRCSPDSQKRKNVIVNRREGIRKAGNICYVIECMNYLLKSKAEYYEVTSVLLASVDRPIKYLSLSIL